MSKLKKIVLRKNQLDRQTLENPFHNSSLEERLIRSKAIDLRENHTIEDLENGYSRVKIIDRNKLLQKI